jgi:hypothetical protein
MRSRKRGTVDFLRRKEMTIYDESLPFGLLIGIDYIGSLNLWYAWIFD